MAMRFRRKREDSADDEAILAVEIEVVERVLSNYAPGTTLSFGAPTRCPGCTDYGLVEQVDRVAGRSLNRCFRCGTEWVLTSRALRTVRQLLTAEAASQPVAASPERARGLVDLEPLDSTDQVTSGFSDTSAASAVIAPAEAPRDGTLFTRRTRRTEADTPLADFAIVRSTTPIMGVEPGVADTPVLAARWRDPSAAPPPDLVVARSDLPSVHDLVHSTPPREGRTRPMRLLLIEDDPHDIGVMRAILEPAGAEVINLRTARTRAAGEEAARSIEPDLVLLDLGLPDSQGLATVTQWHFNASTAPVFVLSGEYGSEILDRGAEFGVSGFMDKAELGELLLLGDVGTAQLIERFAHAASV